MIENSSAKCKFFFNFQLRILSDLFLLARDACPAGPQDTRNNTNSNAILRLIVKKRVCIELSRVPWYLNLSAKEGIETLNYILRVLEELARTINRFFLNFTVNFLLL